MKSVTAQQREKLKSYVSLAMLCKFKLGSTWYFISNKDKAKDYNSNTYQPAYLLETDDIEITSTPKIDDISVVIDGTDSVFIGLFLAQAWMNQSLELVQLYLDKDGSTIYSEVAYSGLISAVNISTGSPYKIDVTVSSVWKDFEKQAGIKTNPTSQQIHYPLCTGFEHVSQATKSTPWGKEGNGRSLSSNATYSRTSKFDGPGVP
ncbi:hypothetical protein [Paraglaciecola sp.]|uniref:hypothetical protein n=1 Tax=Paraglaciecola sp. TaxID=1920173 RepID=UPI003EF3C92C